MQYSASPLGDFANMRSDHTTAAAVVHVCQPGQTAMGNELWESGAEQWLHVKYWNHTAVDCWVAIKHEGAPISALKTSDGTRKHKVMAGDNLTQIAKAYGTTVDKIVADNLHKYPRITSNHIEVDPPWILDV